MPPLLALPFPTFLDPVALELGPVVIRWYALAYMAAFILGWRYALKLTELYPGRPNREDIDAFLTWAVIGVILGGRLGYVLFYRPELLAEPLSALALWEGGMAFHGGAAGVVIAIFAFAWRSSIDPIRLGDVICAVVPIGLLLGRIANFVNNELWGRPSDMPWAVIFPIPPRYADIFQTVPRHPSQLYEAALEGLVLLVLLGWMMRQQAIRERPGIVAGTFLAGYGLARFVVEFFREPDPGIDGVLGLSRGQTLSLPMIAIGLALAIWAAMRRRAAA